MIKIALTSGCPKGIGPEISVSAASHLRNFFEITIYGDRDILYKAAELKGVDLNKLHIEDIRYHENLGCGGYSFEVLKEAAKNVIDGKLDVLVTSPINKQHWNKAGIPFIGHTEFLADICKVKQCAMMMASPNLKITLATIHLPLKDVPANLTREKIVTATELTYTTLVKQFGINNPKVAIAALNPHAGDSGLLGDEEKSIIKPVIESLRDRDINASGPYPPDSVFWRAIQGDFDAVVAMYHDQGLAAIKTLDYKNTVNITLGLPIIRTSVDHGTAEDIAWQGTADDTNMIAAIKMAITMAEKRDKLPLTWPLPKGERDCYSSFQGRESRGGVPRSKSMGEGK